MESAYRWFIGILALIAGFLALVYGLVRISVLKFTLQLCGKHGNCTTFGDPWSYLLVIAKLSALMLGVALAITVVVAVLSRRKLARDVGPGPPNREDGKLPS